jgi:hypothetical protein
MIQAGLRQSHRIGWWEPLTASFLVKTMVSTFQYSTVDSQPLTVPGYACSPEDGDLIALHQSLQEARMDLDRFYGLNPLPQTSEKMMSQW